MFVAAGLGALVMAAAPFVAVALATAAASWLLWHVRPWRIIYRVARAVARLIATLAAATRSFTDRAMTAVPRTLRAVSRTLRAVSRKLIQFVLRPREPWRPALPAPAARLRLLLTELLGRTIPARQKAHRAWQRLAAAGALRAIELANRLQLWIIRITAQRRHGG
jgi:hypothetical protein